MARKLFFSYFYRHVICGIAILVAFGCILLITNIYEVTVISSMGSITYELTTETSISEKQPVPSSKRIKQCLNATFYNYNLKSLRQVDLNNNNTRILITGITSCNGYYLSKYFINNVSFPPHQMIGMHYFRKNSHFQSQMIREQELTRMGINIIHGNLCDAILLTEIVEINNISVLINAAINNKCQGIISNIEINRPILITSSRAIVHTQHHLYSDYRKIMPVTKKYLLISTLYIAQKDPLHSDQVHYTYNTSWCIEYMDKWYNSFKKAININDLTSSQYDIVVIHDGLKEKVLNTFDDIIFVNMGQFPMKKHRNSANDLRYYDMVRYLKQSKSMNYKIVLTTDMRDVQFAASNPFQYLENKHILNGKDIFVGAEDDMKDDKKAFKRWRHYIMERILLCYGDKTTQNMSVWINNTWSSRNKNVIPTNPGIIATNRGLMIKLIERMVDYFNNTKHRRQNCNFPVFFISLTDLCVEKENCNIINDKTFHSPFRKFLLEKNDDSPRHHIIYHK